MHALIGREVEKRGGKVKPKGIDVHKVKVGLPWCG
jgi:hypothetical protein